MPKITLPQIQEELAGEGWQVLSTSYTNLSTEMEFLCPEGHTVYSTWSKLRTRRECPVCAANVFKDAPQIIIEKKKGEKRFLALDQASHRTGWSVFDGRRLVKYGIFDTSGEDEIKRFHEVRIWLVNMIKNWKPDLIGIEGIQYQANFGVTTFQTLARLQGIVMETCYEAKIPYQICPTNTWRAHCGVKGTTRADKKRSMQMLIKKNYDVTVSDDEADAIGIGTYLSAQFWKKMDLVEWE